MQAQSTKQNAATFKAAKCAIEWSLGNSYT